jgi:uncharacterized protein (TIGR00297 family)
VARRNGAHELIPRFPLSLLVTAAAVGLISATESAGLHVRPSELVPGVQIALATNCALALAAMALGAVTASGALSGIVIGSIVLVTTGWPGWMLLGWAFAMTVTATQWRQRVKERRDIGEANGGRRGAGNVWANTGLAALLSVAAASRLDEPAWIVAVAAALAAGATDTVASEVGKAIGGKTWLLPTFREVPPGTTGAISSSGTIAAALAGLSSGAVASLSGLLPTLAAGLVVATAVTASCVLEGWVAVVTEERGVLDNDGVNFVGTALAAAIAAALSSGVT